MASANNLGTAYIKIAPSMVGIQSAITKGFTTYGSDAGTAFNKGFVLKNSAIATTIATVTSKALGSITSRIDDAIARVDTLRVFPKIMKNLGYEAEESSSAVQLLSDRIEGLPTTLDEIVSYTQRLASTMGSLNKGTKNATKLAIAFNDAALAGGKGQAEANRAFEQFVQVISRGRPSMQDWKIMMEVMPGQLKQMARYMYDNNDSLKEYAKNAKKTADKLDGMDLYEWISEDKNAKAKERLNDLTTAIIELDENGGSGITSFKDQVGDATHTIGTAMRLIPVRITKALATVIEAFGADDIYNTLDKFTKSFKDVGNWVAQNIVPIIKNQVIPVIRNLLVAAKNVVEFIAQNKWVQDVLAGLLKVLIGFKVLKETKNLVVSLVSPVVNLGKSVISVAKNVAVANSEFTRAFSAGLSFETAIKNAQGATNGLTGALVGAARGAGTIISGLGVGGIATAAGLAATALLGVKAGLIGLEIQETRAKTAQRDFDRTNLSASYIQQRYSDSLKMTVENLNALKDATNKAKDAEYDYLKSKEDVRLRQEEYNSAVKSGAYNADQLRIMEIELKSAQDKLTDSEKAYTKQKAKQAEATENFKNSQLGLISQSNTAIAKAEIETRQYGKLAAQMDDLIKKNWEYVDENGKAMEASSADVKSQVDFMNQELSRSSNVWREIVRIAEENGISYVEAASRYSKQGINGWIGNFKAGIDEWRPLLSSAADATGKSISDNLKKWVDSAQTSGQNWIQGLINGISNNSLIQKLNTKVKSIADEVIKKLNKQWKIGSPSRIAAQIGRYFDMGLINGLDSYADKIVSVSDSIAQGVVDSFDKSASINAGQVQPMAPTYGQLGASESDNAKVIQNNVFNQVDSELDVKEASRLLGWQVATTI